MFCIFLGSPDDPKDPHNPHRQHTGQQGTTQGMPSSQQQHAGHSSDLNPGANHGVQDLDSDPLGNMGVLSTAAAHLLAKPVPMRRLSEKRIAQARASLSSVGQMSTGGGGMTATTGTAQGTAGMYPGTSSEGVNPAALLDPTGLGMI